MNCKLYLIEDEPDRHMAMPDIVEAANKSNLPFTFLNSIQDIDVYNKKEVLASTVAFLQSSEDVLTAIHEKYSIIFLDLNIKDGFEPLQFAEIAKCANIVESKLKDQLPASIEWANALENAIRSASRLSCLVAGARIVLNLPLIFVATSCGLNFSLTYGTQTKVIRSYPNFPAFGKKQTSATGYEADIESLIEQVKESAKSLTEFHSDPYIDKALKMYNSQWENASSWIHAEIRNGKYLSAVNSWLTDSISQDDLRAIIMRGDDGKPFNHGTGALDYACPDSVLSVKALNTLLRTLNIPSQVSEADIWWEIPIVPGLPFFLSLREFLSELESGGAPLSINFLKCVYPTSDANKTENPDNSKSRLYSISMQLGETRNIGGVEERCKPFQLGINYHNTQGVAIQHSNTTRALINLTYARLAPFVAGSNSGLKVAGDWLDIFTSSKYKTDDGNACPCVGVCFYPHGLRIVWAGEGVKQWE